MVWDKEWPNSLAGKAIAEAQEQGLGIPWPELEMTKLLKEAPIWTGLDLVIGEKNVLTTIVDGIIKHEEIKIEKVYNNLKPTHDPYTNPNAILYHECDCGAILDPGTKSFAALNNAASNEGWKIRWKANGDGYEAFCAECGKDVE